MPNASEFRAPSAVERVFNKIYGTLVGLGIGFSYNYLLQVRGRKSGRIYSTPIDLLQLGGKSYLVAPRGRTQWVRNVEAAGEVMLKKGSWRNRYKVSAIAEAQRPEILKAYLEAFKAQDSAISPFLRDHP